MAWVEESGFEFDLPDGRYFRFEECETYQSQLSHAHLAEVDFGWHEPNTGGEGEIVWLMEVKNIRRRGAQTFSVSDFVDDLVNQLTDGILMVSAVWSGSSVGQKLLEDIRNECPSFPSSVERLRVVLGLHLDRTDGPHLLMAVVERVRQRLTGRLKVLGKGAVGEFIPPVVFIPIGKSPEFGPVKVRSV